MVVFFLLISQLFCTHTHAQKKEQYLTNVPWSFVKQKVQNLVDTCNDIKKLDSAREVWGSNFLDDFLTETDMGGNTWFAFASYVGDTTVMQQIIDLAIESVFIESPEFKDYLALAKKDGKTTLYDKAQKIISAAQALRALAVISQPDHAGTTPLMYASMSNKKEAVNKITFEASILSEIAEDVLNKDSYENFMFAENVIEKNALMLAACQEDPDINLINILIESAKKAAEISGNKGCYIYSVTKAIACTENEKIKNILLQPPY